MNTLRKTFMAFGLAFSMVPMACSEKPKQNAASAREVAEVSGYLSYIHGADTAEGLEHKYTSGGLNHLAKALNDVTEKSGLSRDLVGAKLDSLLSMSDSLRTNPGSEKHPAQVRAAFIRATEVMETLQGAKFPDDGDEVQALRAAAESISTEQSALDQKPKIIAFFDRAGDALSAMVARI
jgi:hypothetical protein